MRVFYYNLDNAAFVDAAGEQLSWVAPDLYYQEDPDWCFMLKRGENTIADLSDVVAWGAAVDCDFSTSSVPMCRTSSDGITADPATGAVTVSLDCSTAQFLAAVDGNASRRAWFELYGLDTNGKRILYLCIEIRARMIVDPDPEVSPDTPDTLATKAFVSAYVQQSGAIMEDKPFSTTVGPYTMTYTSSGGLLVSGGGVALQVSSGVVVASASSYDDENGTSRATVVQLTSGGIVASGVNANITASASDDGGDQQANVTITSGGVNVNASTPTQDANVSVAAGSVAVSGTNDVAVSVNSRPVALGLVTSTDSETTSASFAELAGGTAYIYTQPLTALTVDSVTSDCDATIKFTAGAGLSGIGLPSSCYFTGERAFTSGGHYFAAFNGADVVVIEQQKLDEA